MYTPLTGARNPIMSAGNPRKDKENEGDGQHIIQTQAFRPGFPENDEI